ncbi:MAG TPA: hypothetical protein VFU41_03160 [Gemmatimonadales bacterium]|nr:hypothetical protein [Gemmatimonadales bacterium]
MIRPALALLALAVATSACQPEARRLLLLDLALSDPLVLSGTAQPWRDAGYEVEYRRFYPHLTWADLARYRTLVFLLGREPEAPSDALTAGDLVLLNEWVRRGGVVVLGYDGDGEGYLDRWTANRWLESRGAHLSIGDRVLEDTTARVSTTGRPQPWAVARPVGDEPLGSVYAPFPLDRNHVVLTGDRGQLLAVTSQDAFVRTPAGLASRADAGIAAAARIGDGLAVVISRHALGTIGPQYRPSTMPTLGARALAGTTDFLTALARWTRRPAEWAHVPPAAHGVPLALQQAPLPVELLAPRLEPPASAGTAALPLIPDPAFARAAHAPGWLRQQGMRVFWLPLLATRDGRRVPRPTAALDSLVTLLDAGGFNLLAGDADPASADSLRARWDERLAVRRAWSEAVKALQPTSVAWIPVLDYGNGHPPRADSSRGARGEQIPAPCALDSAFWGEGLAPAYGALVRLAAEQRTLVIALGLELGRGYGMGQEFCDAAWRQALTRLTRRGELDSLPYPERYPTLRETGLLSLYYRALEDLVAERAAMLRDRALRQRRDLYFAFRLPQAPADWFTLGILRGFGLPDRPLLLLTPEVRMRHLLTGLRARGLNTVHAVELTPAFLRSRDLVGLKRMVFEENDGFWVPGEESGPGTPRPTTARLPGDSLARLARRLAR